MIVLLPPLLNDDLRLMTSGKKLAVEAFSPKRAVETLNEWIFPRAAGLDVQGIALPIAQPLLQRVGDKLRKMSLRK